MEEDDDDDDEIVSDDVKWINLAQDSDRKAVSYEGGHEPSGYIKCGEFHAKWRTLSLSRRIIFFPFSWLMCFGKLVNLFKPPDYLIQ